MNSNNNFINNTLKLNEQFLNLWNHDSMMNIVVTVLPACSWSLTDLLFFLDLAGCSVARARLLLPVHRGPSAARPLRTDGRPHTAPPFA